MFLTSEYLPVVQEKDYQDLVWNNAQFTVKSTLSFNKTYEVSVDENSKELRVYIVGWRNHRTQVKTENPTSDDQLLALQYRNTVLTADTTPIEVTAKSIRRCNSQAFLVFFLQCSAVKREELLDYLMKQVKEGNEVIPCKNIVMLLNELSLCHPEIAREILMSIMDNEDYFKALVDCGATDFSFVNGVDDDALIARLREVNDEQKGVLLQAKTRIPLAEMAARGSTGTYFDVEFLEKLKTETLVAAAKHWKPRLIARLFVDLPCCKAQAVLALLEDEKAVDALYELQSNGDDLVTVDDVSASFVMLDLVPKAQQGDEESQTLSQERFLELVTTAKQSVSSRCFDSIPAMERGGWFEQIENKYPKLFPQLLNKSAVVYLDEFKSMMSLVDHEVAKRWGPLLTPSTIAFLSPHKEFASMMSKVFSKINKKSCNAWCEALKNKRSEIELMYKRKDVEYLKMLEMLGFIDKALEYLIDDLVASLLKDGAPASEPRTALEPNIEAVTSKTTEQATVPTSAAKNTEEPTTDDTPEVEAHSKAKAQPAVLRGPNPDSIADYIHSPASIAVALNSLSCSSRAPANFISISKKLLAQHPRLFFQVLLCLNDKHYQFITQALKDESNYIELLEALSPQYFKGSHEEINHTRASQIMLQVWNLTQDVSVLKKFFSEPANHDVSYLLAEFEPTVVTKLVNDLKDTQHFLMGFVRIMQEKVIHWKTHHGDESFFTLFKMLRGLPQTKISPVQMAQYVSQLKGCRIELLKRMEKEDARQLVKALHEVDASLIGELLPETNGMSPGSLLEILTVFPDDWVMQTVSQLHEESVANVFVQAKHNQELWTRVVKASLAISSMRFVAGLQRVCLVEDRAKKLKEYFELIDSEAMRVSCLAQLNPKIIADIVLKEEYFRGMAVHLSQSLIEEINGEMKTLKASPKDLLKKR